MANFQIGQPILRQDGQFRIGRPVLGLNDWLNLQIMHPGRRVLDWRTNPKLVCLLGRSICTSLTPGGVGSSSSGGGPKFPCVGGRDSAENAKKN